MKPTASKHSEAAAVTKNAPEPELATTYLDFLKTAPASECFEAVGFTPLSES